MLPPAHLSVAPEAPARPEAAPPEPDGAPSAPREPRVSMSPGPPTQALSTPHTHHTASSPAAGGGGMGATAAGATRPHLGGTSAKQVFEQAAMSGFSTLNMNGPSTAKMQAERYAADVRSRRRIVTPDQRDTDGSEEARFFQAYEQGHAARTRFGSRSELRLVLVDLALALAFSRRSPELLACAVHLVRLLEEDALARRELVLLAQADASRPETIDVAAMLANTIGHLMGICGRVRDVGSAKMDAQLELFLVVMRLVSDLRLALAPALEAALAPESERHRMKFADGSVRMQTVRALRLAGADVLRADLGGGPDSELPQPGGLRSASAQPPPALQPSAPATSRTTSLLLPSIAGAAGAAGGGGGGAAASNGTTPGGGGGAAAAGAPPALGGGAARERHQAAHRPSVAASTAS